MSRPTTCGCCGLDHERSGDASEKPQGQCGSCWVVFRTRVPSKVPGSSSPAICRLLWASNIRRRRHGRFSLPRVGSWTGLCPPRRTTVTPRQWALSRLRFALWGSPREVSRGKDMSTDSEQADLFTSKNSNLVTPWGLV